jgi:hypothetical protein
VLITETVYAAPPEIEPTSICQLYYYCEDWRTGWLNGCGCDGNPCYSEWYKYAKKYKVAPPTCEPVLVGKCEKWTCTHEVFRCCGSP